MVSVVIVHSDEMIRRTIRSSLEWDGACNVVAETSEWSMVATLCRRFRPRVVLLEAYCPVDAASELTHLLTDDRPGAKILVVSSTPLRRSEALELLKEGFAGCVTVQDGREEEIPLAVDVAARGGLWLSRDAKLDVSSSDLQAILTAREREVLQLMARGLSNTDIAARLGVSRYTVKNHVSSICRRLEVRGRTSAVLASIGRHLVSGG